MKQEKIMTHHSALSHKIFQYLNRNPFLFFKNWFIWLFRVTLLLNSTYNNIYPNLFKDYKTKTKQIDLLVNCLRFDWNNDSSVQVVKFDSNHSNTFLLSFLWHIWLRFWELYLALVHMCHRSIWFHSNWTINCIRTNLNVWKKMPQDRIEMILMELIQLTWFVNYQSSHLIYVHNDFVCNCMLNNLKDALWKMYMEEVSWCVTCSILDDSNCVCG